MATFSPVRVSFAELKIAERSKNADNHAYKNCYRHNNTVGSFTYSPAHLIIRRNHVKASQLLWCLLGNGHLIKLEQKSGRK